MPIVVAAIVILPLVVVTASASPLSWAEVKDMIRRDFPDVSQISTIKLAGWMKSDRSPKPLLIDARAKEEYDISHLKGAVLATSLKDAKKTAASFGKNHPIVVYCSVGYRSSELASRLQKAGYTNVHNLEGSIFQWSNEGRPLFRKGKPTTNVHPYDKHWGRLLNRQVIQQAGTGHAP